MRQFVKELNNRNVFRVGALYIVGGWLGIQAAQLVAPSWAVKILIVLVVTGLPFALLTAWFFELTPKGIKLHMSVLPEDSIAPKVGRVLDKLVIGLAAVAALHFGYGVLTEPSPADTTALADVQQRGPGKSIVVLPLDNGSTNPEDAYFADGVHAGLISRLGAIADLQVVSRSSALRFRDTTAPKSEIAAELDVATVLEGGVQRSGPKIRMSFRLTDVANDRLLWNQNYDREFSTESVFKVQRAVVEVIARELQIELSEEMKTRLDRMPTDSMDAYRMYLKGRRSLESGSLEGLMIARRRLAQALAIDVQFAEAHSAFAETFIRLEDNAGFRRESAASGAGGHSKRAIDIAPDLADAWTVAGLVAQRESRHDEAELAFKKAIELAPNDARAYEWYGDFVREAFGDESRANQLYYRALVYDPMSAAVRTKFVTGLFDMGLDERAMEEVNRLGALHPNYGYAHFLTGRLHWTHGDLLEGLQALTNHATVEPDAVTWRYQRCDLLLNLEAGDVADACYRSLQQTHAKHPAVLRHLTLWHLLRGDHTRAVAAVDAATATDDASDADSWACAGFVHSVTGNYTRAAEAYARAAPDWMTEKQPTVPVERVAHAVTAGLALRRSGNDVQAERLLRAALAQMEDREPARGGDAIQFSRAGAYSALGDTALALDALADAVQKGARFGWVYLEIDPSFDAIRHEDRYRNLLKIVRSDIEAQRDIAIASGLL